MQRVTVTLDDALAAELDAVVRRRGYQNRSEAMRDLLRSGLQQMEMAPYDNSYGGASEMGIQKQQNLDQKQ